jgi:hypothetical protein
MVDHEDRVCHTPHKGHILILFLPEDPASPNPPPTQILQCLPGPQNSFLPGQPQHCDLRTLSL